MKKALLLLITVVSTLACDNSEDSTNELYGQWQLTEVLVNVDGTYYFSPTSSDKVITFFSDESLACAGDICANNNYANEYTIGTFSETFQTISSNNCNGSNSLTFEQTADTIVITYPGTELSQAKYIKLLNN